METLPSPPATHWGFLFSGSRNMKQVWPGGGSSFPSLGKGEVLGLFFFLPSACFGGCPLK